MTATPALADYEPNANDVVGAGSDTLEFMLDFGADGDVSADPGYNAGGNLYKLVSIDATADSNARDSFALGSTLLNSTPMDPTAVYRAGTYPVQRINGSGAGINALLADTSSADPYIDFARMSSNPTTAEGATAVANGWQGLQDFVLGTEKFAVVVDAADTNAPPLSAKELYTIYTANTPNCVKWNQLPGAPSTASSDAIIPDIPQNGSGTYTTFVDDIEAAAGVTSFTQGTCDTVSEENDPTPITNLASTTTDPDGGTCTPNCAADAIEPFSGARLNLWQGVSGNTTYGPNPGTGYFHDPTVVYPGGAALAPGVVQVTTGTPSDGNPVYVDVRNLNVVYRWTDQISTTPWQPGGTENWAQTLFCNPGGPTPFFQTAEGKLLLAEAGANPATQSCLTSPLT